MRNQKRKNKKQIRIKEKQELEMREGLQIEENKQQENLTKLESSTAYFDGTKHTIMHERQLGQLSSYIVVRMVNFK